VPCIITWESSLLGLGLPPASTCDQVPKLRPHTVCVAGMLVLTVYCATYLQHIGCIQQAACLTASSAAEQSCCALDANCCQCPVENQARMHCTSARPGCSSSIRLHAELWVSKNSVCTTAFRHQCNTACNACAAACCAGHGPPACAWCWHSTRHSIWHVVVCAASSCCFVRHQLGVATFMAQHIEHEAYGHP
jgi:hypothetical protein